MIVLLFLYEPDQLAEPTVHGSHLLFQHEGLVDLERQLQMNHDSNTNNQQQECGTATAATTTTTTTTTEGMMDQESFQYISVAHCSALDAFQFLHRKYTIRRLLAHQETGHWESFRRDKEIRRFCRSHSIPFVEYNQTGVTRCLRSRDDFSTNFQAFVSQPQYATPNISALCQRIVQVVDLPGFMPNMKLFLDQFPEIPQPHRHDRPNRQQTGGLSKALATLNSFLSERGSKFSQGISSPNTAWTSCSRLSPYLTWGQISHRQVIHALAQRQEQLLRMKQQGRNIGTWLQGLKAFSSRVHWRSHFIQKLESEPMMEKRDLCPAYQALRRQQDDWNETYYQAWAQGKTGFPFVDACMRCLIQHGWLNFRMRAMLVSFATYNLWLDWKRIAPHLARVFLDYEPGIHYPQLQMQAGTTGINAMRVYNTTKQGKDHDAEGKFIRQYVPELKEVPTKYIHEPSKMPLSLQQQYNVLIGRGYPKPIVNEQESAKVAKKKVADVKRQAETNVMANQVYKKHGSRSRGREEMEGRKPKALSSFVQRDDPSKQLTITSVFQPTSKIHQELSGISRKQPPADGTIEVGTDCDTTTMSIGILGKKKATSNSSIKRHFTSLKDGSTQTPNQAKRTKSNSSKQTVWTCRACTFLNEKPLGLVCSICDTPRYC